MVMAEPPTRVVLAVAGAVAMAVAVALSMVVAVALSVVVVVALSPAMVVALSLSLSLTLTLALWRPSGPRCLRTKKRSSADGRVLVRAGTPHAPGRWAVRAI